MPTSVSLVPEQSKTHDWFKQRLVKGTVVLSPDLFPVGVKPTEVPFIDGDLELHSVVQVEEESITFSGSGPTYTFNLDKIDSTHILSGSPGFAPVRSVSNPNTLPSQFTTLVSGTPSSNGEWSFVINASGTVTVTIYSSSDMRSHVTSYRYTISDPGVDAAGLYSIDYDTGTIQE